MDAQRYSILQEWQADKIRMRELESQIAVHKQDRKGDMHSYAALQRKHTDLLDAHQGCNMQLQALIEERSTLMAAHGLLEGKLRETLAALVQMERDKADTEVLARRLVDQHVTARQQLLQRMQGLERTVGLHEEVATGLLQELSSEKARSAAYEAQVEALQRELREAQHAAPQQTVLDIQGPAQPDSTKVVPQGPVSQGSSALTHGTSQGSSTMMYDTNSSSDMCEHIQDLSAAALPSISCSSDTQDSAPSGCKPRFATAPHATTTGTVPKAEADVPMCAPREATEELLADPSLAKPVSMLLETVARLDINRVPFKHIIRGDFIGQGTFGMVFAGWAKINGVWRKVAIKAVDITIPHYDCAREVEMMNKAKGLKNVVQLLGVCLWKQDTLVLITNLMIQTLEKWLDAEPRTLREIMRIHQGWTAGLQRLASRGLTHRDVKPDNIMVDEDGEATIIDMTLLRGIPEPGQPFSPRAGSYEFLSYESLTNSCLTAKNDVWGAAVVMWWCFSRRLPFSCEDCKAVEDYHVRVEPNHKLPSGIPLCIETLLRHCFECDVNKRPSLEVVQQMLGLIAGNLDPACDPPRLWNTPVPEPHPMVDNRNCWDDLDSQW